MQSDPSRVVQAHSVEHCCKIASTLSVLNFNRTFGYIIVTMTSAGGKSISDVVAIISAELLAW